MGPFHGCDAALAQLSGPGDDVGRCALDLAGGGTAPLKFPETVFADDLNLLGEAGCEQGHMVFQVPGHRRPRRLRFALEKSENDPGGGTNTTRVRFAWRL